MQISITLTPTNKLKRGDVFLWQSNFTAKYEIHTFHSDSGYGVKTFTDYNEKDGSSVIVNHSGIRGVLTIKDINTILPTKEEILKKANEHEEYHLKGMNEQGDVVTSEFAAMCCGNSFHDGIKWLLKKIEEYNG